MKNKEVCILDYYLPTMWFTCKECIACKEKREAEERQKEIEASEKAVQEARSYASCIVMKYRTLIEQRIELESREYEDTVRLHYVCSEISRVEREMENRIFLAKYKWDEDRKGYNL